MINDHKLLIKRADTFGKRFKGLMFKRSFYKEGLLLAPCNSVHMFFMRFPIDVVFVDQNGVIVRCMRRLKPWRVSPIVKSSYYVLELPVGSIDEFCLEKGKLICIPADGKIFNFTYQNVKKQKHQQIR